VLGINAEHRLSTLHSGARLITAPMSARPSVAVAFMFGIGSRFENADNSGLAHFVEHMVFKGGRRLQTAKAISEAIEGVGGVLNADTDRESTVFWTRVPRDQLPLAVDVLSDMLLEPLVDQAELAKERLVVLEELRMTEDNPQDHVHTVFDEVMWPDHPLGWDIAGREETVRSFEREQCIRHLQQHYRPDNLVISIAGSVEHDEARAIIDERVGRPGAPMARSLPVPSIAVPAGGAVQLKYRRTEQANIVVGARAASLVDPDRFAVDILNGLLGDGMASRLFLELRENQALAYDVHSFTIRLGDSGALAMYIGCDPARAPQALAAAVAELERLASELVESSELGRAKRYLKGRLLLQLESTSAMGQYLGQQELLTGEIRTAEDMMESVDRVTAEEVLGVAANIVGGGLRVAVIGPFRDPEPFRRAIKAP